MIISDGEIGQTSDISRLISAKITLNSIWQENPFKIQPYYGTPKKICREKFSFQKIISKNTVK